MGRLSLLLLALVAAIAVAGLSTSNAAQQSAKNGCTSNTPFSGTLTTPPFSTATSASPVLSFVTWWETESVNTQSVDTMVIEASTDGVNWSPVTSLNEDLPVSETGAPDRPFSNIGLDRKPDWQTQTVPLPGELALQPQVQLRFNFNTVDTLFNGFRGWGVDNVTVTGESVDVPLPVELFDSGIPGTWQATGFWSVPEAPEDTLIHEGINPPLITLGTTDGSTPDVGLLPANQLSSTGYAWFGQQSTGTFCGENFQVVLGLDPFTAQATTGATHTVNANVSNMVSENAVVRWSVTGANPTSGSAPAPFGTGTVPITWTGTNAGFDSLEVHLDINGNTAFDPDEILQFADVNWAAAAAQPQQQPAQQQPAQQQPTQQQPRRDPFPADVETAATLDQLSNPEPFREINVAADEGPIFVRLPGGRGGAARASQAGTPTGFIPLTQAAQVPVGSIVEASRGRMSLESTADARGLRTQRAQFFDGMFQIRQPRSRRPVTELVLKGGSFRGCGSARQSASWSRTDAQDAQRRRQGRRVRRVWGNGRGNFRTRGRYSSATVRGTTWLTEDRCGGTLTRVARRPRTNRVVVQDFVTRRSRLLRAGQIYFAARPLGRR